MANLINITSVPAEKINENQLQLIARWKDTDKRPISAANRQRAVILPANIWTEDASVSAMESKELRLFLLDAVEELARKYLSTIVEESNWQRTEVNADAFTLSNLLTWSAEQSALSGRLNGEEIKQWLTSSVTIKTVSQKHGEQIAKALGEQFVKLASPNHGLTPEKAEKLLTNIWQTEDADSTTGLRVMMRIQAIRDKAQNQQANALDSIL